MESIKLYKYKKRKIIKQYLYRYTSFNNEYFYLLLKILVKNKYISRQVRVLAIFYSIFLPVQNSIVRQKNICLVAGHHRSVYTGVGMARSVFRECIGRTVLPGYQSARW